MSNPTPKDLGLKETIDYSEISNRALIPQCTVIPPPESVFEINGIPLLTLKSLSVIIGKAKSGKSTVTGWIIAQVIGSNKRVLWIDTEQGLYYGSITQFRILQIAGLTSSINLEFYDLKIHAPNVRIEIIEHLISSKQYDLIVIDGIRDLVFDINSPEEATNTATNLMRWADLYNTHVINILHQNKGNDHARGHLGSELVNKAELVIKVSQDEDDKIVVEPEFCRGLPFEAFALSRDEQGTPYLAEDWILKKSTLNSSKKEKILLPNEIDKSTHLELLQKMFENEPEKKYKALWKSIQNEINTVYGWHIANTKAENYVQYYIDNGIILVKGKTPQTKYFINPDLLN